MANEAEITDKEIRAHIKARGPLSSSGWGPRKTLSWNEARKEILVLRRAQEIIGAIERVEDNAKHKVPFGNSW